MNRARGVLGTLLFVMASLPALAQYGDGHIRTGDSLQLDRPDGIDSTGAVSDTLGADSAFFQQIDSSSEPIEPLDPETFFKKRGGFFGSAIVELTALEPDDLDPALDGTPVVYGLEGYVLLSSWMLGGGGGSATLYGMSANYDQFSYGYGGVITGYDTKIFYGAMSLQTSLMIGAGGLEMIRRRPDLGGSAGHEILERVRQESFFCLRPRVSIGFSPLSFMRFSVGASYMLPLGGEKVADLRKLSYGLGVTLGLGD